MQSSDKEGVRESYNSGIRKKTPQKWGSSKDWSVGVSSEEGQGFYGQKGGLKLWGWEKKIMFRCITCLSINIYKINNIIYNNDRYTTDLPIISN